MPHTKRPTPLRDSPFSYTRPAGRRGWIDRVLRRPRADLAARALQHLLSQRDPTRISPSDISTLLLEYDVAGAAARSVLVQMWRQVLEAFLSDDAFSDREIAYLEALREAFALTEEEVQASEREVVHPRYAVARHLATRPAITPASGTEVAREPVVILRFVSLLDRACFAVHDASRRMLPSCTDASSANLRVRVP